MPPFWTWNKDTKIREARSMANMDVVGSMLKRPSMTTNGTTHRKRGKYDTNLLVDPRLQSSIELKKFIRFRNWRGFAAYD